MRRFEIITEADARTLAPGETVELAPGGHVTPLARDTLRERRITLVDARAASPDAMSLVPAAIVRRIALGSDHTGIALRTTLLTYLRGRGLFVDDIGPRDHTPVDYPDIAAAVARQVARGEVDAGIVIDGSGIGSAIAANKIRGVRAAMCSDEATARYSREHNGANVLTLGSTLLHDEEARAIVAAWIGASMREPRYIARLLKIRDLEQ